MVDWRAQDARTSPARCQSAATQHHSEALPFAFLGACLWRMSSKSENDEGQLPSPRLSGLLRKT
jgi:hypothetical protein